MFRNKSGLYIFKSKFVIINLHKGLFKNIKPRFIPKHLLIYKYKTIN